MSMSRLVSRWPVSRSASSLWPCDWDFTSIFFVLLGTSSSGEYWWLWMAHAFSRKVLCLGGIFTRLGESKVASTFREPNSEHKEFPRWKEQGGSPGRGHLEHGWPGKGLLARVLMKAVSVWLGQKAAPQESLQPPRVLHWCGGWQWVFKVMI